LGRRWQHVFARGAGEKDRRTGIKLAEAIGTLNVLRGKGAPGSFNVKGTFDANTIYNYLDVVAFNGSSWVAIRDRPAEVPALGGNCYRVPAGEGRGDDGLLPPKRADAEGALLPIAAGFCRHSFNGAPADLGIDKAMAGRTCRFMTRRMSTFCKPELT
jgi:hypothetical protein